MIYLGAKGELKAYFGSRCAHRFFSGWGVAEPEDIYGLCLIFKIMLQKSCRKLPVT